MATKPTNQRQLYPKLQEVDKKEDNPNEGQKECQKGPPSKIKKILYFLAS